MKNIVLIGIMGCGKTTIAKLLSNKLNMPVIDLDEYIVNKYKQSINEMFLISEEYFRERETICCKEVAALHNHIISTGGGIIKNHSNSEVLKENGIIIYIDRPIDRILTDVEIQNRPLLKEGSQKLYDLYKQRDKAYKVAANIHIINDDTLEVVVDRISKAIQLHK